MTPILDQPGERLRALYHRVTLQRLLLDTGHLWPAFMGQPLRLCLKPLLQEKGRPIMVDASALARPAASPEDAGTSRDRVAYAATTLLHIRPFDPLQLELLHCLRGCPAPLSLHALAALSGWSPATVVWFLGPLVQHGLVKRLSLPRSSAGEKGAAR